MGALQLNISILPCQRPLGQRRGSAAARLLGLRVRIPPDHGSVGP